MTYNKCVEINKLPKTSNSIGKASIWHTQAERKLWRRLVAYAFMGLAPRAPLKLVEVICVRISASEPDKDNLYASFKHVIDALKYNSLIVDDKPSAMNLKCYWEKGKRGQGKIKLAIKEVEEIVRESIQLPKM